MSIEVQNGNIAKPVLYAVFCEAAEHSLNLKTGYESQVEK